VRNVVARRRRSQLQPHFKANLRASQRTSQPTGPTHPTCWPTRLANPRGPLSVALRWARAERGG